MPRAHDDNFSPSGFTGVANPEKHLLDAGIGVVYGKNAKEIADNLNIGSIIVSISDEKSMAAAFAVAQTEKMD